MRASAITDSDAVIVLRKTDRGAMASGGTTSFTVELDGRSVGWVYDTRRFTGSTFGGRRWLATHRETADRAARWTSREYRTRAAAVEALAVHVRNT